MKWTINPSHLPSYLLVQAVGEPTLTEYREMWESLLTHTEWPACTRALLDMRERPISARTAHLYRSELEVLFLRHRDDVDESCFAVVTNDSHFFHRRSFDYGLRLRAFSTSLEYFREMDEAVQWLIQRSACSDQEASTAAQF